MAVSKGTSAQERAAATTNGNAPARSRVSASSTGGSTGPDRLAPGLVGARIRARRLARGISLRQFARDLEVSASFISQLETGKAQPSVATLFAICGALDIATDELFDNDDSSRSADPGDASAEGTDASNNAWRTTTSFGLARNAGSADAGRQTSSPLVHPADRKVLVLQGIPEETEIAMEFPGCVELT